VDALMVALVDKSYLPPKEPGSPTNTERQELLWKNINMRLVIG